MIYTSFTNALITRKKSLTLAIIASTLLPSSYSVADVMPLSASLSYSQRALSSAGNPAAAAMIIKRKDPHVVTGGLIELGAGIEYGDLDELFDKINDLADDFKPPNDGDDPSSPSNPTEDPTWDDLFDQYPNLEDRLDAIEEQIIITGSLLGVIAAEGYGKAEANAEVNFILNENLYGGTLFMTAAYKGSSKMVGILEKLNFDKEFARSQLETIPNYDINDPIQELDLTGGITLFYDPSNNNTKLVINNDSLLLVKAAKVSEISLSYSHKVDNFDSGNLYWGVKPTLYRVGLTNVGFKLGDLNDSEELFDSIRNAEYDYQTGFDFDLGLIWDAEHYMLGASLNNVIEQSYDFPALGLAFFGSVDVLKQVKDNRAYTLERQLKLEAGIFTDQRRWSLHLEVEANSIKNPMKDEYQWATLKAAYASDSWWLPNARIGISHNIVGSKLNYLNVGVTVMKYVNIDISSTLDTVNLDGTSLVRGANIRLGVQFAY